jgi:hypothetical protein
VLGGAVDNIEDIETESWDTSFSIEVASAETKK